MAGPAGRHVMLASASPRSTGRAKPEIRIWDMHSNRLRGKLPGFLVPYGFAVGQSLLGCDLISRSRTTKISVIELESLTISATLNGPEDIRHMACFSDDERYLVVAFAKVDEWGHYFPPFPLVCWDLSDWTSRKSCRRLTRPADCHRPAR